MTERVEYSRTKDILQQDPIHSESTYDEILDIILQLYDNSITDIRLNLNKNIMKRIFNRMKAASKIDIYGTGISHKLAQAEAYKYSTLGLETYAHDGINVHYVSASKKQKTISFVVTFTGANPTMIQVARYLKKNTNSYVIGIAGSQYKEIEPWCDEIILISAKKIPVEYENHDCICICKLYI